MLLNFLLLSSVLFLFCGLALDAGMLQLRKLQLQHAADAAALGAAFEKSRGQSDWVAAGKADAAMNGFTDGVNGVSISIVSPPISGSYSGVSSAVQVNVSQSYHAAFMGMITGSANATPGTRSVGGSTNPNCVYLMGPGSSTYTLTNDSYGGFFAACGMYVNSQASTINNNTGSTLSVTGGNSILVQAPTASGSNLGGPTSPTPTWNSASEADPLGWETAPTSPTVSTCSTATSSTTKVVTSDTTLTAGTYCGGITVNGAKVTFGSGLYIITGALIFKNGATINGSNVTFYLTAGGGSTYGGFTISNSTVTLSAPVNTSGGGFPGIVVFGDRNWSDQGNQGIQITASSVTTNGIWYALNTGIYNSSSTLKGTSYIGLVVDNIKAWAATFTIPPPDYSTLVNGSPFHGTPASGIVE